MALRLQLAPRALRTLAGCSAAVRERLQHELGALAAGLTLDGPPAPGRAGLAVLDSGFRVRYWLELGQGLLRLTQVLAPVTLAHLIMQDGRAERPLAGAGPGAYVSHGY